MEEREQRSALEGARPHGDVGARALVLVAAVHQALKSSGYGELSDVCCTWAGGSIVVTGRVSSYYMKQMAQCIVQRTAPSVPLDNRLQVLPPEEPER